MLLKGVTSLVIFMSLSLTAAKKCEEIIKRDCQETVKSQCYFDVDRTCFKHFQTNCEMELAACNYGKVYETWAEKYCESLQFMCPEDLDVYNWPPEYFYEQIAHIRDSNQNQYEGMF